MDLSSPSGRIRVGFHLDRAGAPQYQIEFDGSEVIRPSRLQWVLSSGRIRDGFATAIGESTSHKGEFSLLHGKASAGSDNYHQQTIELSGPHPVTLVFRAYDDAVAFRYELDVVEGEVLLNEEIEFDFADDLHSHSLNASTYAGSFEGQYESAPLSGIRAGSRKSLPMLVQGSGFAAAIHEAAVKDFAGAYLVGHPSKPNAVRTELSPRMNDDSGAAVISQGTTLRSPWRVILMADSPLRLMESTTLLALNPPCEIEDTSWIRPGRVTWDWWCGPVAPSRAFPVGMNTDTFKYFVDFAAAHKLEYCMIDGGWYGGTDAGGGEDVTTSVPELDVPAVVSYAQEKGVGIILWVHSADLRKQLDAALDAYAAMGVKGLKIDFFDRYDQDVVEYCHEILKKAADRQLLINFHGIFSPVGWERTYPNLMTMEGVLGAEYNKWSSQVTPAHNCVLPFTRMLAGPMDYTVGIFNNSTPAQFSPRRVGPTSIGTRAQNLAMYVVYESALQMVSDSPDEIWGQPGSEFIADAPASWDETRALQGEPGSHVVIARRKGDVWWLGGMTNHEARTFAVNLDFLSAECQADVWLDGPKAEADARDLVSMTKKVKPGEALEVPCASAGGFAARFSPIR